MLTFNNLHKSIEETAREFEHTVLDSIPVDTGKLKQSVKVTSSKKGFDFYAEEYIYYLKAKHSLYRTDGRSIGGDIVASITKEPNQPLPDLYVDEINIENIIKGINKDIDTWLEQK